jgi:hypothetical protein
MRRRLVYRFNQLDTSVLYPGKGGERNRFSQNPGAKTTKTKGVVLVAKEERIGHLSLPLSGVTK